jgi:two-component system sensor histidine kinase YesM
MKPEELENLRSLISGKINVEEKNGYGMANVEKRLEMLYGKDYGMSVESEYEKGTIVTVKIPAVAGKKEENDKKQD